MGKSTSSALTDKKNTKRKQTSFFTSGIIFSAIGGIYFAYNIVYMIIYTNQNVEYYLSYGYETKEIIMNLVPTLVSNFFTPIGIFGAAIIASFGINAILLKLNQK